MTPALQDLRLIARLILYWLVAGIVPPSRWQTAMELCSKAWSSKKLNRTYADVLESIERFERALGRSDNAPPERKAADVLFGRQESTLCMLRECWPWGWNPTIRVSGAVVVVRTASESGAKMFASSCSHRYCSSSGELLR